MRRPAGRSWALARAWRAGAGAAAALAALALAAGCGSSAPGSVPLAAVAPLKIGYLASLSGYCASAGAEYVKGAELAVRELNAQGGVLGHRVELFVRDDRDNPATGVSEARALVTEEGVGFLAGTCASPVGKSVAELVANPDHVLYVAGVTDPSIFAGAPQTYVFGTLATAAVEGENAAAYLRAHRGWRRIALLGEDYSYSYQVTAALAAALRGSGQRIVSATYLRSGAASYAAQIRAVLAQRPDAIYSTVVSGDALTLVRDGLPLGLFGRGFLGVMDYGTLAAMARLPLGAEGYTLYPSAAIYHTRFSALLQTLGTSIANGGAAGDAFNQIEVIAQGIERARSTDPTRVRDALGDAQVAVVQGTLRFDRCNHVLATPIAMGTVSGPTESVRVAHLQPPVLVPTGRYLTC